MTTITTFAPDLRPYYGTLKTGQTCRIQAKVPVYATVGHGSFSALSDNHVAFSGKIDFLGHKGNVDLAVTITGTDAGTVEINGKTVTATFASSGGTLTAYLSLPNNPNTHLEIQWWHGGMWIGGPGTPKDIWVGV